MSSTNTVAPSLKGTQTEVNLGMAFMSESTAVTRYTFFSQAAEKEGYYQYANIFKETADNELHHAKIFLKHLNDGGVTTAPMGVDAGIIGSTLDNLKVAASEEQAEGVDFYKNAADVAEKEGFTDLAAQFRAIATVEMRHLERFKLMQERIEKGEVWKRDKPIKWQCLVCGYIYEGTEPPQKCPGCYHPYQHFEPEEDNY